MATTRKTVNDLTAAAHARLVRLEPRGALEAMERGSTLIDTRCGELLREKGTIPGSVHVPLSVLFWRLDPASGHDDSALCDPTRQVILICAHGYSSSLAAATLQELGFARATDVIGGFAAWAAAGLPIERPPEA